MASYGVERGNPYRRYLRKTANSNGAQSTTCTDVSIGASGALMSIPLIAGHYYTIRMVGVASSNDSTVGPRVGFTFPAVTDCAMQVNLGASADGANTHFSGTILTSGDSVTTGSTEGNNTNCPFNIHGVIVPSADGNLVFQAGLETGTTAVVTIKAGTILEVLDYT